MKFTLKDYQQTAVASCSSGSSRRSTSTNASGDEIVVLAHRDHRRRQDRHGGRRDRGAVLRQRGVRLRPRPGAVVIWFSDDPNLNEQTRSRLMEASDKLTSTRPRPHRAAVRHSTPRAPARSTSSTPRSCRRAPCSRVATSTIRTTTRSRSCRLQPDLQGWTIWETIANTIDADDLTVYLVLDEAHRGFTEDRPRQARPSSAS